MCARHHPEAQKRVTSPDYLNCKRVTQLFLQVLSFSRIFFPLCWQLFHPRLHSWPCATEVLQDHKPSVNVKSHVWKKVPSASQNISTVYAEQMSLKNPGLGRGISLSIIYLVLVIPLESSQWCLQTICINRSRITLKSSKVLALFLSQGRISRSHTWYILFFFLDSVSVSHSQTILWGK